MSVSRYFIEIPLSPLWVRCGVVWCGVCLPPPRVLYQRPGSLRVLRRILAVPSTALFWTESADVVPGICSRCILRGQTKGWVWDEFLWADPPAPWSTAAVLPTLTSLSFECHGLVPGVVFFLSLFIYCTYVTQSCVCVCVSESVAFYLSE